VLSQVSPGWPQDPRCTVEDIVAGNLRNITGGARGRLARVVELLDNVGLDET
jgi:hypothetical protein